MTYELFHDDLLYYWIIIENVYTRHGSLVIVSYVFFFYLSLFPHCLTKCNSSFPLFSFSILYLAWFTDTVTLPCSFSQYRDCHYSDSIFFLVLTVFFIFFYSNKPQNLQLLRKKTAFYMFFLLFVRLLIVVLLRFSFFSPITLYCWFASSYHHP